MGTECRKCVTTFVRKAATVKSSAGWNQGLPHSHTRIHELFPPLFLSQDILYQLFLGQLESSCRWQEAI